MSIASEISRLQSDKAALKAAINAQKGGAVLTSETLDAYAAAINGLPSPATLEPFATTVRTSASATENIATNDRIRIRGNDGHDYTLAQWNALFVAAGYNKDNMTVTPIGLRIQCNDADEVYMFDRYTDVTYQPFGGNAGAAGKLAHSIYNNALITAAENGTDYTTGKAWSVTGDGDTLTLYEANTKQSWTMKKNCGGVYAHRGFNMADRLQSLWAQTEWMRHRMAIDSGLATTEADGTMGEIDIFDANGDIAAVNADMYFWIKEAGVWVNTGKLAKYNRNNLHGVNSESVTQAIADAIYTAQKANGVNMNDTGVNSDTKPVLAPGSKGAEAIAVNGYWYIITPFISYPNATVTTANTNMADAPAVYWAKSKGFVQLSDAALFGIYVNKALCDAIINYLNNKEGRSISAIPTGDYTWSGVRYSAKYCWLVNLLNGIMFNFNPYYRYFVVGASAL